MLRIAPSSCFFFNDTATTEIYTLSLHDALPISLQREARGDRVAVEHPHRLQRVLLETVRMFQDRKSTRLNSSHVRISYAVFCLKKKYRESERWTRVLSTTPRKSARTPVPYSSTS